MSPIFTSLLIGFLALDTTIAFQVLIAQPIFSCTILGYLLGNFTLGVEIGTMMQLLWLHIVPAGASVFPEGNVASMVTCAIVLYFDSIGVPNLVFTIAFVIGIGVSYIGAWLTVLDRKLNSNILDLTLSAAAKGSFKKFLLLDFVGILIYFLIMSTLALIALEAAGILIPFLNDTPLSTWEQELSFVKPAIWGIGISFTS
ncbi:MAG: hypothetical protein GWN16_10025, partial [Calditrichae bacterium]|nr:hypothetical protein [Calditrichia bacterium]